MRLGRGVAWEWLVQAAAWRLLVGVFVVVGLVWDYRALPLQAPGAPGAWETTDAWLAHLELTAPSATLRDRLRQPSALGAVLFVGTAGDPTFPLTYYVVSYLAWPRRVGAVQCRDEDRQALPYVQVDDPITTVLFYQRSTPAALRPAIALGPHLAQAAEGERRAWTQYCSR